MENIQMKTTKRVAFYVRVSTDGQTVENQLQELHVAAQKHGWEVVKVFKDEGISGAKGRDQRPDFDALCKGLARKDFDLVASWSVDRLGRSLQDLITFLSDMNAKGIDLYLHQQGLDTSTPSGRAMFQMLGVVAEFERSMIQSRVKAGLERAKAQGKKLGRPKTTEQTKQAILKARSEGKGIRKIASELHVGVGTVINTLEAAG
jgi:DNA invertase Pin-like site-specific DNA recombinase